MSTIFTLEKIFKAYKDCQKGKKNTANALVFEMDRERNLIQLLHDLQSRSYQISRHICFIVTYPTVREVFAANFRDRVVHHLLCNEIQPIFEADFIERSYANRREKGTHAAVKRLTKDVRQIGQSVGDAYYLKLDVESFFRSINKEKLYSIVEKKIFRSSRFDGNESLRSEILWLAQKIIFHDPTSDYHYKGDLKKRRLLPFHKSLFSTRGKGLPIGNLTSQFFANTYLNELDHFVMRALGIDRYVRYVDDFVIVGEDRDKLKSFILRIDLFLKERLDLRIHRGKIFLQNTRKGVDFLGYFIKPTHTLVRQKVVNRFKAKLAQCRDPKDGLFKPEDIPMIKSYEGHFKHANSYRLRKKWMGF